MYTISNWKRSRSLLEYLIWLNFTLSNKFFFLLEKLQNEKQYWDRKQKVRRYYFSVVFESRVFGWRYDRSQNRSTAVCRWGYMPLNVQSYWSNRSRERAVDSVASIWRCVRSYRYRYRYYSSPHTARYWFCVDKQTLSAIFFYTLNWGKVRR